MNFIKATAFLILFIIITNNARSQTFYFLKAGINLSNVHITNLTSDLKNYNETRPILLINIGAYAQSTLDKYFSLKWEIKYAGKGYRYKNDYTANLHYLNFSLLGNYRPVHKLSLDLGPEIGGLLYSVLKTSDNFNNAKDIFDGRFEFSGVAGINYEISPKMGVSFRIIYGLTKIMSIIAQGNELKYKNQILELSVNYNFKKSRKQVIL